MIHHLVIPGIHLVIPGPPRTKKNALSFGKGRVFHGGGYSRWEREAALIVRGQWSRQRDHAELLPAQLAADGSISVPVNLGAKVFRARDAGDLLNYLAAISDVLERAGIVEDDRLITRLDGCALLLDRENPRVEIEIAPL